MRFRAEGVVIEFDLTKARLTELGLLDEGQTLDTVDPSKLLKEELLSIGHTLGEAVQVRKVTIAEVAPTRRPKPGGSA